MSRLSPHRLQEPDQPIWVEPEWVKAVSEPIKVAAIPPGEGDETFGSLEGTSDINIPADADKEGPEQSDYSWRRKAVNRRMRKCHEAETGEKAEDFVPVFINPRVQDGSPVFELTEADLAGRMLVIPGESARFREMAAMVAACLFAVLLATVACAAAFNAGTDEALLAGLTSSVEAKREVQVWREVRRDTSRIPEAGAAMEAFLRARTPEEKVRFVRGGSAMLPAMHRYYSRHPDEPEGFSLTPGAECGTHAGKEFLFIHGSDFFGGTVETAVECTASGVRLDWRFLTGAADMEWDDWIAQQPAIPVSLRVEAVLDDYYAGPFSDPLDWLCLKITRPGYVSVAWAYIRRNTDDGLIIYRQLNRRGSPVRLLGTFEFPAVETPGRKSAPQVQLVSVATQGWLDRSPDAAAAVSFTFNLPQATDQP